MRHRRSRTSEPENAGEDSFMDVVANLVGILLILIMVVGVRTRDAAIEEATSAPVAEASDVVKQRDEARKKLSNLESAIREVKQQAETQMVLADLRHRERHELNVLLTAARLELDERRKALSKNGQEDVQRTMEIKGLEKTLSQLASQRDAVSRDTGKVETIDHLPTPLAKTVFGNEEHFRLEQGYLLYVPLNELTDRLREAAPRRAPRLMEVPQFTETIGPIQGFHMRYTMERRDVAGMTNAGPVVRSVAELKQFVLVPTNDDRGEPLADALVDGSQFRQLLDALKPGATVITVWTYPDSFADFRRLKQWLFDRGFACAARPLPAGQPIMGSPDGSRSAAQ